MTETQTDDNNTGGIANLEFVQNAHAQIADKKRADGEEAIRGAGTREWLESELKKRTKTVEIYGREFEFLPPGTSFVVETVEQASKLGDDEDISAMPGLYRNIISKLADSCVEEAMDEEAFGRLPPEDLQDVFERVASGEMDEEELERVDEFRTE